MEETEVENEILDTEQPTTKQEAQVEAPEETEVDHLRQELGEARDKYLRILAELENVKKRNARERSELQRYAGEHIARDLLVVLDDLQRACSQDVSVPTEELLAGVKMIAEQFASVFERHGIKAANAQGEVFDPKVHEALASVPTDEHPSGTVIEQLKKAYFFRDKLLRPAQVVVSTATPKAEPAAQDNEPEAEAEDGEKDGEPM